MKVDGVPYRSLWANEDGKSVSIIDQTRLPHEFEIDRLETIDDCARAIVIMQVRGAPLIGATAAYGVALECQNDPSDANIAAAVEKLAATRPTAVNLFWALRRMNDHLMPLPAAERAAAAWSEAQQICDEDVESNSAIGTHGLGLIEAIAANKNSSSPVNILTHCNAGWLATVDWGTALAPIYKAFDSGIDIHVYVDETRPRNQGAHLTAWELGMHGVPHTLIVDNAGGHLMQRGLVDAVIVGSDRTTGHGDVCNKIGTYLKALAAHDNDVPFYVTLPTSTIDFEIADGLAEIPIEERDSTEVTLVSGLTDEGKVSHVSIVPEGCAAANPAFDVTPRRFVSGLVTEKGVVAATPEAIATL